MNFPKRVPTHYTEPSDVPYGTVKVVEKETPRFPSGEEMERFKLDATTPILAVQKTYLGADGSVLKFSHSLYMNGGEYLSDGFVTEEERRSPERQ